jgi:hypothetical protein
MKTEIEIIKEKENKLITNSYPDLPLIIFGDNKPYMLCKDEWNNKIICIDLNKGVFGNARYIDLDEYFKYNPNDKIVKSRITIKI